MSDKTLKTKSKAFVRNVQRPIAEKVEQNVQYHVEVKSVSIRSVNIPVNKLKDRSVLSYLFFYLFKEHAVYSAHGANEREEPGPRVKECTVSGKLIIKRPNSSHSNKTKVCFRPKKKRLIKLFSIF